MSRKSSNLGGRLAPTCWRRSLVKVSQLVAQNANLGWSVSARIVFTRCRKTSSLSWLTAAGKPAWAKKDRSRVLIVLKFSWPFGGSDSNWSKGTPAIEFKMCLLSLTSDTPAVSMSIAFNAFVTISNGTSCWRKPCNMYPPPKLSSSASASSGNNESAVINKALWWVTDFLPRTQRLRVNVRAIAMSNKMFVCIIAVNNS
mmetsp:Transcript_4615/g.13908  ORF Transcript_4615/g.13908 Transcript_4615/m.13908 type:complete len:200 (+) Transcript_4615:1738-2337(+)